MIDLTKYTTVYETSKYGKDIRVQRTDDNELLTVRIDDISYIMFSHKHDIGDLKPLLTRIPEEEIQKFKPKKFFTKKDNMIVEIKDIPKITKFKTAYRILLYHYVYKEFKTNKINKYIDELNKPKTILARLKKLGGKI